MAIGTVNARYEGFIFDGENSRTYGVYVTDVEVFGTPERDVESVSVPGRNGDIIIDHGRFKNIKVIYKCAIGADIASDFKDAISDLRNMLASRVGYKRLEDEINTSEYRMAVFTDGLEVETLNKEAATFKVEFDCKPQRFLKSGETAVSITSGDELTNPTPFDARPLIAVDGYGTINIGDYSVTIAEPETAGTLYIDCDIMDSYQIIDGEITPRNGIVTLDGNEYPVLTGTTEISYSGNITGVDITPRWWAV